MQPEAGLEPLSGPETGYLQLRTLLLSLRSALEESSGKTLALVNLTPCQPGLELIAGIHCVRQCLRASQAQPRIGFDQVFGNAVTVFVPHTEIVLSKGIPLLCGGTVPFQSFLDVLGHASAHHIKNSQGVL